ncbi:hypothetical protein ACQP2F_30530 [Actinoplanes sp. CA-030573]|uniref:hypothetical protein n=1 Tax=Actinoplanes sp. CA-030573 TaxID=3239898 RepID=UPI003D9052CC
MDRAVGKAPTPERALTDVIRDDTPPAPIFVDPSGSRRRRVRWIAYVIGLLLIVVVVAVWITQLTGPATPPPVPAPCPSACAR